VVEEEEENEMTTTKKKKCPNLRSRVGCREEAGLLGWYWFIAAKRCAADATQDPPL